MLKAGFSEVLLKPITPADILASVKRHVPIEQNSGATLAVAQA